MKNSSIIVGVLAFQGDFAEHIDVLKSMNVRCHEVRSIQDLQPCTHLIVPGGESTVMAKFFESTGVGSDIQKRVKAGSLAVYGTCAGAILIAKKATGKNAPKTLGLIDMTIDRNAYGSQIDSFETTLSIKGIKKDVPVSFIRAPKISVVGTSVDVLAHYKKDPVLVRQGNILAGTFHPEVQGEDSIHRLFLSF